MPSGFNTNADFIEFAFFSCFLGILLTLYVFGNNFVALSEISKNLLPNDYSKFMLG